MAAKAPRVARLRKSALRKPRQHHMLAERPKLGKQHYRILALCWAGWIFDIYDLILFTFLIPPISISLHLNKLQMSYALGVSLGASALGGIVMGALADLYGRRRVLEWTILTYSAGTLLSGFAHGLVSLIVFRIITGFGVGGEWATGHTYIGETFPPRFRSRYAAFMQTGGSVGCLMAAAIGGFVAPHLGWRLVFIISALPAVLSAFVRRALPESDVWLARHPEARKGRLFILPRLSHVMDPIRNLMTGPHRRDFVRSIILCSLDMSAFYIAFSWLPTYFEEQRHLSAGTAALIISIAYVGILLGQLIFGYLADAIGRRASFSVFSCIMATGLLSITLFWSDTGGSFTAVGGAMFVTGFGAGMFGGYGPLFTELFPTAVRNTAMGGAYNMARGTQLFTPTLVALLARELGLSGGIALSAAFALATGVYVWTFPPNSSKIASEVE
ncbi:MAG TPA: MFS transporter [Candidatus Binataceae bacterium]|nr:MFS transporter [Candidatus Binataceae bacterium]